MRRLFPVVMLAVSALIVGSALIVAAEKAKTPNAGAIRHVVLFKFKDGTSAADVKKIEEAFAKLPGQIKEIEDFEWGTNNSPEGLAQGFTHCFFVTFKDTKARDAYLPHAAHKAFVEVLKPHLDKVLVVDYEAKK